MYPGHSGCWSWRHVSWVYPDCLLSEFTQLLLEKIRLVSWLYPECILNATHAGPTAGDGVLRRQQRLCILNVSWLDQETAEDSVSWVYPVSILHPQSIMYLACILTVSCREQKTAQDEQDTCELTMYPDVSWTSPKNTFRIQSGYTMYTRCILPVQDTSGYSILHGTYPECILSVSWMYFERILRETGYRKRYQRL